MTAEPQLKLPGITMFLLAALVFGLAVGQGPMKRYSPEGIPGALFSVPIVILMMLVGPLFYKIGVRMANKKKKSVKAKADMPVSKNDWR